MSIFYKITAPNGKVSSLFGTIHSNDTAFVTLPLEVKNAFEQATDCVFETDVISHIENPICMFTLAKNWRNAQDQYLTQIPQDYVSSAKRNLKKIRDKRVKVDPEMASLLDMVMEDILHVSPVEIALGMMEGNAQPIDPAKRINPLDQQLMRYAKLRNKKTGYLEPIEDQINAFRAYNLNISRVSHFY